MKKQEQPAFTPIIYKKETKKVETKKNNFLNLKYSVGLK